jgi:hypothetical protein
MPALLALAADSQAIPRAELDDAIKAFNEARVGELAS